MRIYTNGFSIGYSCNAVFLIFLMGMAKDGEKVGSEVRKAEAWFQSVRMSSVFGGLAHGGSG